MITLDISYNKASKLINAINDGTINRFDFTTGDLKELLGKGESIYSLEDVWGLLSLKNDIYPIPLHLSRNDRVAHEGYELITEQEWEQREKRCGRL